MNNIKIMSRIKPIDENNNKYVKIEGNKILIRKKQSGCFKERLVKYEYNFDRVFQDTVTNLEVFYEISTDMLYNFIKKRKNIVFYVYGETGSGKTHTILGSQNEEGFFKMILQDMIAMDLPIHVSVIQIYNNKFFDVLNNNKVTFQKENGGQEFVLSTLKKQSIENEENINSIKECILSNRKVGRSGQNDTSSRTHLCIIIYSNGLTMKIIDLAGCEKASQSICTNKKMCLENGGINQSLFNLKECIRSLVMNKKHIPYRRCELTKFLRDSFSDSCKTFILSTINPHYKNQSTNIDVFNYITDIRKINIVPNRIFPTIQNSHIESPRFQYFKSNQSILSELQNMEENILNRIFETKTTKHLFADYINVIEKKQDIMNNYNKTNNIISVPPIYPKPKQKYINKKRKLKEKIQNTYSTVTTFAKLRG